MRSRNHFSALSGIIFWVTYILLISTSVISGISKNKINNNIKTLLRTVISSELTNNKNNLKTNLLSDSIEENNININKYYYTNLNVKIYIKERTKNNSFTLSCQYSTCVPNQNTNSVVNPKRRLKRSKEQLPEVISFKGRDSNNAQWSRKAQDSIGDFSNTPNNGLERVKEQISKRLKKGMKHDGAKTVSQRTKFHSKSDSGNDDPLTKVAPPTHVVKEVPTLDVGK